MVSFRFFEFTNKSVQRRERTTNRCYNKEGSKQYHETVLYRLYQRRRDFDSLLREREKVGTRRERTTNRCYNKEGSKQYHEIVLYRLYQRRRDFDSLLREREKVGTRREREEWKSDIF